MSDCIFCKIANKQIPSHQILEDEFFFAFLDNHPLAEGHTLIIPKLHYRWVYDVPNFSQYWDFVLKVTNMIKKSLNPEFITYLTIGNEVSHAHIHLIPRFENDQHSHGIDTNLIIQQTSEEISKIAAKIKS